MQDKNNFDDNSYNSSSEPINSEGDKVASAEPSSVKNDDSPNDSMPAEEVDKSGLDESKGSAEVRTDKDLQNLSNPKSESDKPAIPDSPSVPGPETGSTDNDEKVDPMGLGSAASTEAKDGNSIYPKDANGNPDGNCNNDNLNSVTTDNNDNDSSIPNLVIYRIDIAEKVIKDWYNSN